MFTKQQILDELKRVAAELGRTPGKRVFAQETGIQEHDWAGKIWINWSDALAEAGLVANTMQAKLADHVVETVLVGEVRRLGRFPLVNELKLRHRDDPTFPSEKAIRLRGSKAELIALIIDFCKQDPEEYGDVLGILEPLATTPSETRQTAGSASELVLGHVYLLKLGKHYKIGRSNAFGRRERELAIQMPERATTVHVINTDDPVGIEAYWHRRFAEKRVRQDAEWFALSTEDVSAFRRRKFQ